MAKKQGGAGAKKVEEVRKQASSRTNVLRIAVLLGALAAYVFSGWNRNDLLLAPWSLTYGYCYLMHIPCGDRLDAWATYIEENFDWSVEKHQPGEVIQVPEIPVSEFSAAAVRAASDNFRLPVVVRGLFNDTEAAQRWKDPQFFKDNYGEDVLIVLQNGRLEESEKFAAEKLRARAEKNMGAGAKAKCTSGYASVQKATEMSVSDAVDGMVAGKGYYLSNVDTLFRKHNELIDQTEVSDRIRPWVYGDNPYRPAALQVFMGMGHANASKTTGTPIHCAWGANAFVQMVGCKHWFLVPQRYAAFISPRLSSKFPAAIGEQFPDFLPRYNTTICGGDLLFNPAWMWHRVSNREGFSIGIATRENHPTWQLQNAPGFTLLHELSADNEVSTNMVDWLLQDVPPVRAMIMKGLMRVPLGAFSLTYLQETFIGLKPNPLMDAWSSRCDEHDPRCVASVFDRMVYSYDDCIKGNNANEPDVAEAAAA